MLHCHPCKSYARLNHSMLQLFAAVLIIFFFMLVDLLECWFFIIRYIRMIHCFSSFWISFLSFFSLCSLNSSTLHCFFLSSFSLSIIFLLGKTLKINDNKWNFISISVNDDFEMLSLLAFKDFANAQNFGPFVTDKRHQLILILVFGRIRWTEMR